MNRVKRNRYILSVVFFILAVALVVSVYLFRGGKPIVLNTNLIAKDSSEGYFIDKYKEGFITYNGDNLIFYDSAINQRWVLQIGEKDTLLYSDESYILLMSRASGNVYLIRDGKVITKFKEEKSLQGGSVNVNGYICLLTEDKGYTGQCSVYKSNGDRLVTYSYGEKYIINASLAKDNVHLALNVIDETNGSADKKIIFTNIKKGEDVSETLFSENVLYSEFRGNNLLVSDQENLYMFTKTGKEKWAYNYGGNEIEYLDFSDRIISVVLKSNLSFGKREIHMLDGGGRLKGKCVSDTAIGAFDVSETSASFYTEGKILLIDRRGHETGMIETDLKADEIMLYRNESSVVCVTENEIRMNKFWR